MARSLVSACAASATSLLITLATLRSSTAARRSTYSRKSAGNGTETCSAFITDPPSLMTGEHTSKNLGTHRLSEAAAWTFLGSFVSVRASLA
jgi:hypothetical protein